jgi:predicted permease
MTEFFRRLGYLVTRNRRRRELEAEMAFHREMAERSGRSDARRTFGNPLRLQEQAREAWGWTWLDRLMQDLRYATRMLFRSPGFTLAAVLVLTIGIGINVAAFTLFDWDVLQPMPVRDPSSLIRLERRSPENTASWIPYPTATFYRDHARTLSALIATLPASVHWEDEQPLQASFVSANYFQQIGASAAYGRLFDPARDESPTTSPIAVLGHEFWRMHLGSDPFVVGKIIRLNRKPVTVIGVLPEIFRGLGGQTADVWLPVTEQPYLVEGSKLLTDTSSGNVLVFARLAPGITARMAEQDLLRLTNELRKQHPNDIWKNEYIHTDPGGYAVVMGPKQWGAMAMLGLLMLLILIVTCTNLGGLLLARGVARQHEINTRLALGASRARVVRQLVTESVLLAVLGSAGGLAFGCTAIYVIDVIADAPKWQSAAPDWRVLLFAMGMVFVSALFFGLAPALQLARQQHKKTIARQVLVSLQVAASCVLAIGSSLLVRGVQHALYTNPGFGFEQVVSVDPGLSQHGYSAAAARAYLDELQRRLRALPGVASVSRVRVPPRFLGGVRNEVRFNGRPLHVYPNLIDPDFFTTMDIPLLLGRNFQPGDTHAMIVSQSFAQKAWPGENPLGKIYDNADTVIGMVGSARINALSDDDTVEAYYPIKPEVTPELSIIVKTHGDPESVMPKLRSIVQAGDPKLFPEVTVLKSAFHEWMKSIAIAVFIINLVGSLAMLLAAVGILGLVAYTVTQRTKEIAIRLALGAPQFQVLSAVLRQFRVPVLIGLLLGIASVAALSQVLRGSLFGISNLDPIGYAAGIAVLLGVFAIAALLPARRALKLDVARALHEE